MNPFTYRDGSLYAEDVAVSAIAAAHGTPCYIYSRAALETAFMEYRQALEGTEHLICYAVKANSNLAVLDVLARLGAGFDIVSGGELERVITRERPDALQINYSLGEPEAGDRLLRAAAELGIAVLINRPFASGQLFGAVRGRELPPVAAELGCSSWAQLFLKWILADQAVTCVLIGTSNPAHVADNLGAASGPLPDREQREAIRQAWLGAS